MLTKLPGNIRGKQLNLILFTNRGNVSNHMVQVNMKSNISRSGVSFYQEHNRPFLVVTAQKAMMEVITRTLETP